MNLPSADVFTPGYICFYLTLLLGPTTPSNGATAKGLGLRIGEIEFTNALARVSERDPYDRSFSFGDFSS
jgi:hypothetical protein